MTTTDTSLTPSFKATHQGGCHCGAVRFEVSLPDGFQASRCNCTICAKTAWTGTLVKPQGFRLLSGEEALSRYGDEHAGRYFCKHCGIQCYGSGDLEVLGGAFVSVNLNALDDFDVYQLPLVYWDGRHDNWMAGSRTTPWPITRVA